MPRVWIKVERLERDASELKKEEFLVFYLLVGEGILNPDSPGVVDLGRKSVSFFKVTQLIGLSPRRLKKVLDGLASSNRIVRQNDKVKIVDFEAFVPPTERYLQRKRLKKREPRHKIKRTPIVG